MHCLLVDHVKCMDHGPGIETGRVYDNAHPVPKCSSLQQGRMERLEIESAASDASSKILASWPMDVRHDHLGPALPASSSDVSTQSSSGKAALPSTDRGAPVSTPQHSSKLGKQSFLEAVIQPGMQAHIQVTVQNLSSSVHVLKLKWQNVSFDAHDFSRSPALLHALMQLLSSKHHSLLMVQKVT